MTTFFILDTPIALFSLSYAEEPVWVFRVAATAADFPSGKAEPTRLGSDPIRRRQRRMRGNLPGPEGLARPFARAQPLCHGGVNGSVRGGVCGVARLARGNHHGRRRAPCIRSLRTIPWRGPSPTASHGYTALPTRLTRNTQTGSSSRRDKARRL